MESPDHHRVGGSGYQGVGRERCVSFGGGRRGELSKSTLNKNISLTSSPFVPGPCTDTVTPQSVSLPVGEQEWGKGNMWAGSSGGKGVGFVRGGMFCAGCQNWGQILAPFNY